MLAKSCEKQHKLHNKLFFRWGPYGKEVVLKEGAEAVKAAAVPQPCPRQECKTKIITLYRSGKSFSTFFPHLNQRLQPFHCHAPFGSKQSPHLLQIHLPNFLQYYLFLFLSLDTSCYRYNKLCSSHTELTTLRVEPWPCTCFNHHAFFGAWPKLLPSEVTFRNVSFSEGCSHTSRTADTTVLCKLLHPQPCHIPALLAATALVLLHCRAQLGHNCTPSFHRFSAVDSRPGEL